MCHRRTLLSRSVSKQIGDSRSVIGRLTTTSSNRLFSDAETTEDRTQQIIRGVRAGDFAERVMRLAQVLCAKLERGSQRGRQMRRSERKMLSSRVERSHMALTCEECIMSVFLRADNFQNRLAQ
jgi:hypothetical protein